MKKSRILGAIAAAALAALNLTAVTANAEGETYHAYFGVQSASFTFRNAWNEAKYGQGQVSDDGMVYFDQLTGWDGPTALSMGGTFTDAEITGNGTYSVSMTDFDFGEDETLNLLFISTDIPLDAGVSFSNVKVIMDGQTKYTFDEAYLNPDEKEYVTPHCINIWNDDLGKQDGLFGYMMPQNSIELQFTVSGMATDNPDAVITEATTTEAVTEAETEAETTAAETEAETEAETTAAETEAAPAETEAAPAAAETSSSSPVGIIIGIVAAVVVVAVIVVVVIKKKK